MRKWRANPRLRPLELVESLARSAMLESAAARRHCAARRVEWLRRVPKVDLVTPNLLKGAIWSTAPFAPLRVTNRGQVALKARGAADARDRDPDGAGRGAGARWCCCCRSAGSGSSRRAWGWGWWRHTAGARAIERQLFGVPAADLATFVSVPLVLGVVAAVACWVPARRAARVDPAIALSAESGRGLSFLRSRGGGRGRHYAVAPDERIQHVPLQQSRP